MIVKLTKSKRKDKKFMVEVDGEKIHFGADGYGDYIIWNKKKGKVLADKKKKSYLARHKPREDWTNRGIKTAGFWSRYLLWSKPSLDEAIRHTEKKFNINIIKN